MILPKEIFAFVLIEYIQQQQFHPYYLGVKVTYAKDDVKISFDRDRYTIPLDEVQTILEQSGLDFDRFKSFCEDFMESPDFEIAMRQSLIKPKE